jgi:hypothetical protein
MKDLALLLALGGCVFVGCHKEEAAPPAAPTPESAQTGTPDSSASAPDPAPVQTQVAPPPMPSAPAKLPPPPAYVTRNADNNLRQSVAGQVDPTLTGLLRSFVQKKGRMPNSFAEFASGAVDSPPPAPEGKHWVIDASDTSVKAVSNK